MPRYRKRPIKVEAVQWFPGVNHPGVTPGGEYGSSVRTAHGQQALLSPGDWIIAEPDGRGFYPCKPDIFAATYDLVDEEKH
jgi:hypothetical protein